MWVILEVYITPIEAHPGGLVEAIFSGLFLGLLSIIATGSISGPILTLAGIGLGVAKHRVTTNDDDSGAVDAEWDRVETADRAS